MPKPFSNLPNASRCYGHATAATSLIPRTGQLGPLLSTRPIPSKSSAQPHRQGQESRGRDRRRKGEKAKERFSAVRLSPAGDHLVVSNKEGLWIADTVTGT